MNKFEQVSSLSHKMSLAGRWGAVQGEALTLGSNALIVMVTWDLPHIDGQNDRLMDRYD